MSIQLFDALDPATEAALRASIQRFGVLVPVFVDQYGRILDGHHRDRIARELGVTYARHEMAVADEAEAREIARTLNADRRHLTVEQRRPVVVALREEGHSQNAIAGALGVSQKTVWNDLREEVTTGRNLPEETRGLDGKTYPATQPKKREEETTPRRGLRVHRDQPFEAVTQRQRDLAKAQRGRIETALSQINGLCRGLRDIDYRMAAAAFDGDEMAAWASMAGELARTLKGVKDNLTEVMDVAA